LSKLQVGNYVTVGITSGANIGFSIADADSVLSNEGVLGVSAGTGSTSIIISNTLDASGVTISAGSGLSISENTSANGGTITLTALDESATNELQIINYLPYDQLIDLSNSSTDAYLPVASDYFAGLMSAADFTKLYGISAGAEPNVQGN
jgi:hypothetical protein